VTESTNCKHTGCPDAAGQKYADVGGTGAEGPAGRPRPCSGCRSCCCCAPGSLGATTGEAGRGGASCPRAVQARAACSAAHSLHHCDFSSRCAPSPSLQVEAALAAAGLPLKARAQELSLEQHVALAHALQAAVIAKVRACGHPAAARVKRSEKEKTKRAVR